jgi:hypothetical protein
MSAGLDIPVKRIGRQFEIKTDHLKSDAEQIREMGAKAEKFMGELLTEWRHNGGEPSAFKVIVVREGL